MVGSDGKTKQYAVITGANRGIGLALAKAFLERGFCVIAGCRVPSKADSLPKNANLHALQIDLTNEESIKNFAIKIAEITDNIYFLLHNAGAFAEGEEGLNTIDKEKMISIFMINAIGPVLLTKAMRNSLKKDAKVGVLVSGASKLQEAPKDSQYSYGASKSAVNKFIKNMSADLRGDGVGVYGLAPGFVKTDMTKGSAKKPVLSAEESAKGLVNTLLKLGINETGRFFDWKGSECDW